MAAFLTGFLDAIGPRLQEKHEQELALQGQKKQGEFNTYWNSMQTAATRLTQLKSKEKLSDEEAKEAQSLAQQYAWSEQQLGKLTKSNKPLNEGFQKIGGFVKQLLTRPSPRGRLQPPQQQSSQSQPQSASQSGPLQPPAPQPSMQGAMSLAAEQSPDAIKARQAQSDRDRRDKEGKAAGLTGRDLAEFRETGKLPTQPAQGTRKQVTVKLADGSKQDIQWDQKSGQYFDNKNEPYEIPDGATIETSKPTSMRPTVIASDYVNLDDAKALATQGYPFVGEDGKALDLDKVPAGMVLQKIHYPDGRTVVQPRNINDKVITFNNQRIAVNPSQVQKIGQGEGTVLGVANPGAVTQREVQAQDAEGNPIAQKLTTERVPNTPPIPGHPAATQAQPNARPSTGTPGTSPTLSAPPSASPRSDYRRLPGMQAGTFNKMLDRITPVREAATQIFGDPSQPDVKSMLDFSNLADNPQSRGKIGKALNLTFSQLESATGGGGVNFEAGKGGIIGSLGLGGVGEWITNAFGLPPALAKQTNDIMQNAIKDLSPEERNAYDATMSTFATMVGLRSLTKASAAQASVKSIEQEIPTIGRFTVSRDQYLDRLQHVAEVVFNGTKGIPESMWNQTPQLYKHITTLPKQIQDLRKAQPSPANRQTPPASKTKYYNPQTRQFQDQPIQ